MGQGTNAKLRGRVIRGLILLLLVLAVGALGWCCFFVADADQSTRDARLIAAALGGHVRILDWQRANSGIVAVVEIERNVMFLILTLIILVAAFNIISGMIMMVKDKGRDIAILRTMGASRGMVLRIFMLSGASIGVVGTLAGLCARDRRHPQPRGDPRIPAEHPACRAVLGGVLLLHAASRRGSNRARSRPSW